MTSPSSSGLRKRSSVHSDCERSIREAYAAKVDQFEKDVLDAISRAFAVFRIRNDWEMRCETERDSGRDGREVDDAAQVPPSRLPQPLQEVTSKPIASVATVTNPRRGRAIMRWSNILNPNALPPAQISVAHPILAPLDPHRSQTPLTAFYPPFVPVPTHIGAIPTHGHGVCRDDDEMKPQSPIPWDDYEFRPSLEDRRHETQPVSPMSQFPPYRSSYASDADPLYASTVTNPFPVPTGPPHGDPSSLRLRGAMYSLPLNPRKKRTRDDSETQPCIAQDKSNLCMDSGARSSSENLQERPTRKRKTTRDNPPTQPELPSCHSQVALRGGDLRQATAPRPSQDVLNLRRSARLATDKREEKVNV